MPEYKATLLSYVVLLMLQYIGQKEQGVGKERKLLLLPILYIPPKRHSRDTKRLANLLKRVGFVGLTRRQTHDGRVVGNLNDDLRLMRQLTTYHRLSDEEIAERLGADLGYVAMLRTYINSMP